MGAGWLLVGFGAAAWLFSIFAAAHFAAEKGRSPALGMALGCLFGVFGLMAVLMMPEVKARRPSPPSGRPRRAKLVYEAWPDDDDSPPREAKGAVEDREESEAFRLITGDGPLSPPAASPSRDTAPDPTSTRSRPSAPSRDLRA